MSSNLENDTRASSSRTERHETPATLHEETPQTDTPNETTSVAVEVEKEPLFNGSKLFRVKTGFGDDQYRYLSRHSMNGAQEQENKRKIYDGYYYDNCEVKVAILKIVPIGTAEEELEREGRILKELEVHENFIRYIACESEKDFVYIATERCLCSVADLLDPALKKEIPMKKDILEELGAKEILRQATRGLHYLHQNNFVHRNIKPNNFLVKEINKTGDSSRRFVIKITDFRLTRKYDPDKESVLSGTAASGGWEAPESRQVGKDLSKKLDVFILGCFYHYVLTALPMNRINEGKPRHPFGDTADTRHTNITNQNHAVYKGKLDFVQKDTDKGEDEKEVEGLIKWMLKFKENERPTLDEVLKNPYFKPSEFYKIYDHTKPGLCVIFNQQEFDNPEENRKGSDVDRDALKNTFTELGFETEVHENLPSFDLKFKINNLASKREFGDYGCLVVCLLSHGIENAIECCDGILLNINKLKYEFSLNNCPTLYGKPKIFIVQTCQGGLKQGKTEIEFERAQHSPNFFSRLWTLPRVARLHLNGTWESSPSTVQLTDEEIEYKKKLRKAEIRTEAQRNPLLMDFLTIKATLPGFVAYRSPTGEGSWFIQALCKVLSEEYSEENSSNRDLEDLLRSRVQKEIDKSSKKYDCNQTMQWEACLSKKVRFCKK